MIDIILALVTWRIASILVHEDMPFSFAARLRRAVGIKYDAYSKPFATNEIARGLMCLWCFSVHVGWAVALAHYRDWSFIVYGLFYSAVSIVIESVVRRG